MSKDHDFTTPEDLDRLEVAMRLCGVPPHRVEALRKCLSDYPCKGRRGKQLPSKRIIADLVHTTGINDDDRRRIIKRACPRLDRKTIQWAIQQARTQPWNPEDPASFFKVEKDPLSIFQSSTMPCGVVSSMSPDEVDKVIAAVMLGGLPAEHIDAARKALAGGDACGFIEACIEHVPAPRLANLVVDTFGERVAAEVSLMVAISVAISTVATAKKASKKAHDETVDVAKVLGTQGASIAGALLGAAVLPYLIKKAGIK